MLILVSVLLLRNFIFSNFLKDLIGQTEKKAPQYTVRTIIVEKTRKGDQALQNEINKYVFKEEELICVIKEEEYKFTTVTRIRYRLIMKVVPEKKSD